MRAEQLNHRLNVVFGRLSGDNNRSASEMTEHGIEAG
jgi:hypothetical protein